MNQQDSTTSPQLLSNVDVKVEGEVTKKNVHSPVQTEKRPLLGQLSEFDKPNKGTKKIKKNTYESSSSSSNSVIDLTDDTIDVELIPTIRQIKKSNVLFFSYDPRGDLKMKGNHHFCRKCLCPKIYCADYVFGKECMFRARYIIFKEKLGNVDKIDVINTFQRVYANAVFAKAWTNNIDVDRTFDKTGYHGIPNCIYKSRIPMLLRSVTKYKNDRGTIIWSPCKTKWMNKDGRVYK